MVRGLGLRPWQADTTAPDLMPHTAFSRKAYKGPRGRVQA